MPFRVAGHRQNDIWVTSPIRDDNDVKHLLSHAPIFPYEGYSKNKSASALQSPPSSGAAPVTPRYSLTFVSFAALGLV